MSKVDFIVDLLLDELLEFYTTALKLRDRNQRLFTETKDPYFLGKTDAYTVLTDDFTRRIKKVRSYIPNGG